MTAEERSRQLNLIADSLVPVAGALMFIATSNGRCAREPEIHEEDCDCQVCRAYVAVQSAITELERMAGHAD